MNPENELRDKILCVSVMQNWGGGEEFLLKLHDNLRSFEFVIITPEGKAEKKFRDNGIKTIINNHQKKVYRDSGWTLSAYIKIIFSIKLSTLRFLSIFKKEKPAIILANGLFSALYVLPAVILTGRKQITIQHLIFEDKSIEKRIVKLVVRFTEKIVCVSNAVKDNLYSILDKPYQEKVIVIPNGIRIPENPLPVSRPGDKLIIGITGSIIRIKGIDLVIAAAKEVLQSHNAELHIYGTTADNDDSRRYETELKEIAAAYGLEDKVVFEGHIDSKEQLYSTVDILINFSIISESFSFSVLEAMSFKKIVIAVNAGGPKEFISDGENGFLVELQNVAQLKETILYCTDRFGTKEFDQIRNKAFETVKNKYSIEKFSNEYNGLFNKQIYNKN